MEQATFGGGCFWCVEAVIQRLKGVRKVVSGYAGGHIPNPDYHSVCNGHTGHAEVIQVSFDPELLSFDTLIEVFLTTHDPTTPNRQGNDHGTQYRSIILYHNDEQMQTATRVVQRMQMYFDSPIITQIVPLDIFYEAEPYHQDYYNRNAFAGYCMAVISPKIAKLKKLHAEKLG